MVGRTGRSVSVVGGAGVAGCAYGGAALERP
jgi:hypothetical protein